MELGIPAAARGRFVTAGECALAALLMLRAANGDLGRIGWIALDDAELARIVSIALAADEFAVVDLTLFAGPLLGTGAAARLRRVCFGFVLLAFRALPFPLGSGFASIAHGASGEERSRRAENPPPSAVAR
jgi:hypothetical protein